MAEGGSSDQEDNPFSFQKFVKKKKKDTDEDSSEEEGGDVDVFDLPDISTPARKKVSELSLEEEGQSEVTTTTLYLMLSFSYTVTLHIALI